MIYFQAQYLTYFERSSEIFKFIKRCFKALQNIALGARKLSTIFIREEWPHDMVIACLDLSFTIILQGKDDSPSFTDEEIKAQRD